MRIVDGVEWSVYIKSNAISCLMSSIVTNAEKICQLQCSSLSYVEKHTLAISGE